MPKDLLFCEEIEEQNLNMNQYMSSVDIGTDLVFPHKESEYQKHEK